LQESVLAVLNALAEENCRAVSAYCPLSGQCHCCWIACKIYHHRPRACRGFRCNMADNTFLDVFGQESTLLLGMDQFGLPLKPSLPLVSDQRVSIGILA
jgi:hypothetical protein